MMSKTPEEEGPNIGRFKPIYAGGKAVVTMVPQSFTDFGFSDPAQVQAVFGGSRPEASARVLVTVPDARTASQIAATIGRTTPEGQ